MLSNVGLCVSERTVERVKKKISDDAVAHAADLMKSGHLFCTTFDNINIYLRKFQQRITNKNTKIHATNCAILSIEEEGLDVEHVENLDTKLALRGQRTKAMFQDILPSKDDDEHMTKAFTCIIAEMIVCYTPESKGWKDHSQFLDKVKKMMPSD